jgi:hypothetical protein
MGFGLALAQPLPTPTDGLALLIRGMPGITITTWENEMAIPKDAKLSDASDNIFIDADFDAIYRATDFAWRVLLELEDYGLADDVLVGDAIPGDPNYSPIAMMESS